MWALKAKAWDKLLRGLWLVILMWPFVLQARADHIGIALAYVLLALIAWPVFMTASTRPQLLWLGFMGSALLLSLTLSGIGGSTPRQALVAYVSVGLVVLGSIQADHHRPAWPKPIGDRLMAAVLAGSLVFGPMAAAGAASTWLGVKLPWSVSSGGLTFPAKASSNPAQAEKALARVGIDRAVEVADTPVMTISGAPAPAYWTVAVYDDFDGRAWTGQVSGGQPVAGGAVSLLPPEVSGFTTQAWTVTVRRLTDGNLPLVYVGTPEALTGPAAAASSLRVEPGLRALWAPGTASYSLRLSVPDVGQDALRKAGFSSPTADYKKDLAVPISTSPKVGDLARSIAGTASGPWLAAESIADYLMTHETYTTRSSGATGDAVNAFLLDTHSGSCDQFSTSLVVMLRELGVPARWVMGYRVGEGNAQSADAQSADAQSGDAQSGDYLVRASDAHSWAEVYVAPYGWVPIDPTPGGQATGSSVIAASVPLTGGGQPVSPDPSSTQTTPGGDNGALAPTRAPRAGQVLFALPILTLALAVLTAFAIWYRRSRAARTAARPRVDGLWKGLARLAGHRGRWSAVAWMTPREILSLVPEESRPAVIPAVRLLERAWYGDETLPRGDIARAETALRAQVGRPSPKVD